MREIGFQFWKRLETKKTQKTDHHFGQWLYCYLRPCDDYNNNHHHLAAYEKWKRKKRKKTHIISQQRLKMGN